MDLCDANNVLQDESGRIADMIDAKLMDKSSWVRLTTQEAFPEAMGETLTTLFYERTAIPNVSSTAWTPVGLNDGSGSSCNPTPQNLEYARTTKQYALAQAAVVSPPLCVNDIRVAWKFEAQLREQYRILEMNTRYFWENRLRDEYMRLAGNKVVLNTTDPYAVATSGSNEDFPSDIPIQPLQQSYLDAFYIDLVSDYAEGAYGQVNGQDQFLVIGHPTTINNLKLQNSDIRQDQRFSSSVNELLAPLGADWAYKGYYYIADVQAPRFTFENGEYVRVPYFVPVAASTGFKYVVNPAYKTAPYQVTFIFNTNVFTSRVPSVITNPGGNTSFDRINYRGEWMWINNKDNVCNPLGNQGYFYGLFMQGSEPGRTEWGYAIMEQVCGTQTLDLSCS